MTSKVGPKGQVVIPKELRDRLGIRPGSAITFRLRAEDGILEVQPRWNDPIRDGPRSIQALTRAGGEGLSATDDLLAMRREDESRWQDQFERWSSRRSSSTRTRSSRSSTGNPAPS